MANAPLDDPDAAGFGYWPEEARAAILTRDAEIDRLREEAKRERRFYEALAEIALAEEANEWARKRAAQALYVITDPPPQEAIDLGRRLAKRYGW